MKLKIVAFGIAKEIIKNRSLEVDYDVSNIADFKNQLCQNYPEFSKLNSIAFAVNEAYQLDEFILKEDDEVVIIPPVAGG